MEDLLEWNNDQKAKIHPVILVGLFHLKFEAIHPFLDGNGRIGRLLMNKMLYDTDYPMLNIAFEDRNAYFTAIEQSIMQKDEKIFLEWFLTYYIDHQHFSLYYSLKPTLDST